MPLWHALCVGSGYQTQALSLVWQELHQLRSLPSICLAFDIHSGEQARVLLLLRQALYSLICPPGLHLPPFFWRFISIICVWAFCLHACLCTTNMPAAWEGQKKSLNPLEQELNMVLSHYMNTWNWIWVLWKSSQCPQPLSNLSSPLPSFYLFLKQFSSVSNEKFWPNDSNRIKGVCSALQEFGSRWSSVSWPTRLLSSYHHSTLKGEAWENMPTQCSQSLMKMPFPSVLVRFLMLR